MAKKTTFSSGLGSANDYSVDRIKEIYLNAEENSAIIEKFKELEKQARKNADALNEQDKAILKNLNSYKEYTETMRGYDDVIQKLGKDNKELVKSLEELIKKESDRKTSISALTNLVEKAKEADKKHRNEILEIAAAYAKATDSGDEFKKMMQGEIKEGIKNIAQGVGKIFGGLKDVGKNLAEPWGKADQAAANFAKSLGMAGKQMQDLRANTINFANDNHIGIKYNKSIEELIALQKSYADQTGRNILLTDKQRESMAAMSSVMGDEAASALAGKLENFGIGLEKAGEMAAKMFNEANERGISFEKYTKTVTDNLTMVQQYGFKNGIQGLTTMAKRANEMRLDMQQVANFAEKVNTVEGAITTAANLQVLGGPFASMGSNPMAMLYEGLNDMEGLQDRMIKMFSGLGRFNKETGQVETSNFDKYRIKEAAKSMGIDQREVFEMVNRAAVRNEISQQVGGQKVSEKVLNYLSNVASFDKHGNAVINLDGKEQKISELNLESQAVLDKLEALNQDEAADIKDIATTLRGWDDVMQGFQKQLDIQKASLFETGLGNFVKGITTKIGESNFLLGSILTVLLTMKAGSMLYGGGKSVVSGWKGIGFGRAGMKALSGAGSTATRRSLGSGVEVFVDKGGSVRFGGSVKSKAEATKLLGKEKVNAAYNEMKAAKSGASTATAAATKGGSSFMKNTLTMTKGTLGGAIGGGLMSGALTLGMHALSGDLKKGATAEDRLNRNKAWGDPIGATVGGAIGTALGGPVGAFIVAQLGSAAGKLIGDKISKSQDEKRRKYRNEAVARVGGSDSRLGLDILSLKGDYNKKEMQAIADAYIDGRIKKGELDDKLLEKLYKAGDVGNLRGLEEVIASSKIGEKMEVNKQDVTAKEATIMADTVNLNGGGDNYGGKRALGGPVYGPPHSAGGVHMELEGNEYVINKESVTKYRGIIEKINAGTLDISRSVESPAAGIKPMVVTPSVIPTTAPQPNAGISKIEIPPVNIKLEGTFKLEAGNQSINLNELVNNKEFVTMFSQMISRQIEDNLKGGYFKDERKNKFATF